jgi:hypothetical protein
MTDWNLVPGDEIRRVELHDRYGGQRQGGIGPSRQSPNVMIFTDPDTGHQHGYLDRWEGGVLHYTGEGQTGDQEMKAGNRQILNHLEDGRALRVFRGSTGVVTYDGEYVLDQSNPYYHQRAPQTGDPKVMRQVIMFRLLPVGETATQDEQKLAEHRPISPETSMAATAVGQLAGDGTSGGQRFQADKYVRRATELYAMKRAEAHYDSLRWKLEDVSGNSPYDFVATKDGQTKHIEVKGTQSAGQEVLLTPNEVHHARTYPDVALFVVHSIQVDGAGQAAVLSGGEELIYDPWTIDDGHLAPIGYAYGVPG